MGVIQRSNGAGFAFETLIKGFRWDLDGDAAMKAGVGGAEYASHAALAKRRLNPVRPEHGGQRAMVLGIDGRRRVVQRAGLVARRDHFLDFVAQSGIGSG